MLAIPTRQSGQFLALHRPGGLLIENFVSLIFVPDILITDSRQKVSLLFTLCWEKTSPAQGIQFLLHFLIVFLLQLDIIILISILQLPVSKFFRPGKVAEGAGPFVEDINIASHVWLAWGELSEWPEYWRCSSYIVVSRNEMIIMETIERFQ